MSTTSRINVGLCLRMKENEHTGTVRVPLVRIRTRGNDNCTMNTGYGNRAVLLGRKHDANTKKGKSDTVSARPLIEIQIMRSR